MSGFQKLDIEMLEQSLQWEKIGYVWVSRSKNNPKIRYPLWMPPYNQTLTRGHRLNFLLVLIYFDVFFMQIRIRYGQFQLELITTFIQFEKGIRFFKILGCKILKYNQERFAGYLAK